MQSEDGVFVSWRLLETDSVETTFNVYRTTGVTTDRLDAGPLTDATCFVDRNAKPGETVHYFVKAVVDGKEQTASRAFELTAGSSGSKRWKYPKATSLA